MQLDNHVFCVITANRTNKTKTLDALPEYLYTDSNVLIVCMEYEVEFYEEKYPDAIVVDQSSELRGTTYACNVAMEHAKEWDIEYFWLLEDDLELFERRPPEYKRLQKITPQGWIGLIETFEKYLSYEFICAGVSPRGGNGLKERLYEVNSRCIQCICFHLPTVLELPSDAGGEKVFDSKFFHNHDFDFTLNHLTSGYANIVNNFYAYDQPASNSPGGCSDFRTLKTQEEVSNQLHDKYPEFVTVVDKKCTNWKGMEDKIRKDVRVSWRKAFDSNSGVSSKEIVEQVAHWDHSGGVMA